MYRIRHAAVGLALATALAPAFAAADTVSDLQAQIQSLLSQVKVLQAQLFAARASSTVAASSTPWMRGEGEHRGTNPRCVPLARNLFVGASGDDVRHIQDMLREDGDFGFTSESTGFFGPMTARAMARFQAQVGVASSTDGSVGPMTRSFFAHICDKPGEGDHGMMPWNGTTTPPKRDGQGERPEAGGMMNGIMGRVAQRVVMGPITANDGTGSITITAPSGEARIVRISASTTIELFSSATTTPTTGTIASLVVGMNAAADGTPRSDGSIDAVHVRAVPAGMRIPVPPEMPGEHGTMDVRDVMQRVQGFMGQFTHENGDDR
jgi:peptidoglycan hydrolase-like protein with peptidoglycan-binding domain